LEPVTVQKKKTPDERKAERIARLARFERMKIHGESRGWQIKSSGGVACWQFIPGGRFQSKPSANAS